PIVHAYRVQPVDQFRQGFSTLLEQLFQRRDQRNFPLFRDAAAGLPDQVRVITGLMDGAVTALRRRGKLTAFRQCRIEVQTFAHATVSSTKVIWIWFSKTRTG